jgi:hypothetical protein
MESREEREIAERVRGAVERHAALRPAPEFVAALQTRLRDAAAERRGVRVPRWWGLAAAAILVAGLGVAYGVRNRFAPDATLAYAAVGDHRNCAVKFRLAERPISLDDAARQYGALYAVMRELPPAEVPTPSGPARVLERHACVYGGRRFAHLVLDYRGQQVSLLVTAAGGRAEPPPSGSPELTSARIDDLPVVSFRSSSYEVFLTGDLAPGDLMALADALDGPLFLALARV